MRLTRDLPQLEKISDYAPKAVTNVYAADGEELLIAELFDERRYPATLEEIPLNVRNAFLAAEDANFYSHPGIDVVSILRAVWVNLRSKRTRQGASTITQQVVKSLLLTRERTYERKAKEAILSYRIERQLSKDDIFQIYLNEIFLGNNAYGVKAAAKVHFNKELDELKLQEAAFLGGLPQRPSQLSDPRYRDKAIKRMHYVLAQMRKNKMITEEEHQTALAEPLEIQSNEVETIHAVPYYATHAIKELKHILTRIDPGLTPGNPGGLKVYTAADTKAYAFAERALQRALRDLDKRQGWRGPLNRTEPSSSPSFSKYLRIARPEDIEEHKLYRAIVTKVDKKRQVVFVQVDDVPGVLNLRKTVWARTLRKNDRKQAVNAARYLKPGDIIEVSRMEKAKEDEKEPVRLQLDQTPTVEGAMVVRNALTGEIPVIVGGYSYQRSVFNRATQGLLQPGSAFKPIIYLSALEYLNYTPSSIVPDSPISLNAGDGTVWSPQNYDRSYLGPITLRVALQRSRNVVSVYLLERIGVSKAISTARKLGITTEIQPNLSIALGTPELHLIELTRAYGAFAAEGWLADSLVIKKIVDRKGKILYEQKPKQQKVLSDEDAFIMANMMKGVVERGTAQRVKALGRPVAGKTGTTNDQMDAWFIGYTPEWVAGVWVGNDVKKTLGKYETGGKAAAPAFIYFMEQFLKDAPIIDFNIPNGVIPVSVNSITGRLTDQSDPNVFVEYFKSGTEPRLGRREIELPQEYLTNSDF
ncbi:UNVERIFIED_CONTAM: hypothetical protein GTU68_020467 [Idotea baltica]|nr:hypothetical protein [Idotea baltica]